MRTTWARAAGAALGIVMMLGVPGALAADPKPFPDEWFFDGAKRPAVLKQQEGKPAQEIAVQQWIGESVSIKEQRGKVVVIDFWATWCGPCMAAIPENVELVKKYGSKGLVFVGVHDAKNGWGEAAGVVRNLKINYPVGLDKSSTSATAYKVQFWPTYIVIDRAGTVRGVGLMPNRVEDAVKTLLAEAAPEGATAASEFGPEFFYGGEGRPAALKALEGKPAPKLKAAKWSGEGLKDDAFKNSVVVLHFFTPGAGTSTGELKKLGPVAKELSAQGVVFVGVCDGRAAFDKAEELVKTHAPELALALDVVEGKKPAKDDETPEGKPDTKPTEEQAGEPVSDEKGDKGGADGKKAKPAGRDRGATASSFGVKFAPVTVVIDRSGKVRAAGVRTDKLKPVIEKLLAEAAPAGDKSGKK